MERKSNFHSSHNLGISNMIFTKYSERPEGAEILSGCCMVPMHELCETICSACHEHTGFDVYDAEGELLGEWQG